MQKHVFGHARTAEAQIRLRIAQSDQDLCCPLTQPLDATMYQWRNKDSDDFAHAQDDLNPIFGMFEDTSSLDAIHLLYWPKLVDIQTLLQTNT